MTDGPSHAAPSRPASPDRAPASEAEARSGRHDPFRWIIENPGTVDLIGFGAAALLVLLFAVGTGSFGWWTLFSVPMVLAGAVCRVRPLLGVIVIGGLAVTHLLLNMPVVLGDAMTFYAMFCAVAYGTPLVHGIGAGAGVLGTLSQSGYWGVLALRDEYGGPMQAAVTFLGLNVVGTITIVAIWALANLQRARVRQLALTRDRAEQAVREREQRTALAVADERARIAREMHDVVAHSLSVIIAQADGGRFVAAQKPEKAVEVLGTIGETGRAALADMRSLLGVLRQEDETSFGPQPGPEQLPELLERADLVERDGRVLDPLRSAQLGPAETAIAALEQHLGEEPFASPSADRLTALGLGPEELAAAARLGRVLRLPGEVILLPTAPALAMRELARLPQPFTTSQARQALGTSRRIAIPLLEHLDARGWTRRLDAGHRQVVR